MSWSYFRWTSRAVQSPASHHSFYGQMDVLLFRWDYMANHGCLHFKCILLPDSRNTSQPARTLIPNSRFLELETDWPNVGRLPKSYVREDRVVQHQTGTRAKAPVFALGISCCSSSLSSLSSSVSITNIFRAITPQGTEGGKKLLKRFRAEERAGMGGAMMCWVSHTQLVTAEHLVPGGNGMKMRLEQVIWRPCQASGHLLEGCVCIGLSGYFFLQGFGHWRILSRNTQIMHPRKLTSAEVWRVDWLTEIKSRGRDVIWEACISRAVEGRDRFKKYEGSARRRRVDRMAMKWGRRNQLIQISAWETER